MPEKFRHILQQPDLNVAPIKPQRQLDTTKAEVAAVTSIAEAGIAVKDRADKEEFNAGMAEIAQKESLFQKAENALADDIINSQDKAQITKLEGRLMSLERGQQEGILSPTEATVRRNALLRNAISSNPYIAPELKAIASTYTGSGRGSSDTRTPTQKGLDNARKEAANLGMNLGSYMELQQMRVNQEVTDMRSKQLAEQGRLNFPLELDFMSNRAALTRDGMLANLHAMVKKDPKSLDGIEWTTYAAKIRDTLRKEAINRQADFAKMGVTFSNDQRDDIEGTIDSSMKIVDDFVKANDKAAWLERRLNMANSLGALKMYELDPLTAYFASTGSSDPMKMSMRVYDTIEKFKGHGGFAAMKQMAKADPFGDAAFALRTMEAQKGMMEFLAAEGIFTGKPSNNPYLALTQRSFAGNFLGEPIESASNQDKASHANAVSVLTAEGAPAEEFEYFLNYGVADNVKKNPEAVSILKNRMGPKVASELTRINSFLDEGMFVVGDKIDPKTGTRETLSSPRKLGVDKAIKFDPVKEKFILSGLDEKTLGQIDKKEALKWLRNLTTSYQIKKKYGLFEDGKDVWLGDVMRSIKGRPQPETPATSSKPSAVKDALASALEQAKNEGDTAAIAHIEKMLGVDTQVTPSE